MSTFCRIENKTKQTAIVATIAAVQLSAKPVATKAATATATFDCVPFSLLLFSFAFHLSAPELTKLIRRVSVIKKKMVVRSTILVHG